MALSERRAAALVGALHSVIRTMRFVAAKDHGHTMTGTLAGILKAVETSDLRPGDLAGLLMVAPSVASRAVAALEADGLVQRRPDPEEGTGCPFCAAPGKDDAKAPEKAELNKLSTQQRATARRPRRAAPCSRSG